MNLKDCDTFRFLWWPGNDLNSDPAEYQMLVYLLGATSSPSCANFGLQCTADDNQAVFSKKVIDTVRRNFYVDDCLKSVPNEVEAIPLVSDLCVVAFQGRVSPDQMDLQFEKSDRIRSNIRESSVSERSSA